MFQEYEILNLKPVQAYERNIGFNAFVFHLQKVNPMVTHAGYWKLPNCDQL